MSPDSEKQIGAMIPSALRGTADSLTFENDNTFDLKLGVDMSGTYSQNGEKVTLTPTTLMGHAINAKNPDGSPAQKPFSGTLDAKGSTLTLTLAPLGAPITLVFLGPK